jgi:hypothetical protein
MSTFARRLNNPPDFDTQRQSAINDGHTTTDDEQPTATANSIRCDDEPRRTCDDGWQKLALGAFVAALLAHCLRQLLS